MLYMYIPSAHDITTCSLYPEGVSTIATITVNKSKQKEKTKESLTISHELQLTLSYFVTAL